MSEDKTQLIIALRNYKYLKTEKTADFTDVTACGLSNEKILLRSIETEGKARFVGVDDVKNMIKVMKRQDYDSGVLISKHFTEAASQEMAKAKIQQVSDDCMSRFDSEKLYVAITNCVNDQCKQKCGKIPLRESDCKGHVKGQVCKVKAISADSSFHFEHGWINLMKNDLKKILLLKP